MEYRVKLKYILVLLASLSVAWLSPASLVLAHEGLPPAPHDVWNAWNWDVPLLLGLGFTGWFYWRGVAALWQRVGLGRGLAGWQAVTFGTGLAALFVALISPLDALSEALFSAHMVQHIILILVAAPLLVLGAPPASLVWAVPRRWQRGLGALMTFSPRPWYSPPEKFSPGLGDLGIKNGLKQRKNPLISQSRPKTAGKNFSGYL